MHQIETMKLTGDSCLLRRKWTTVTSASGQDVCGPMWMLMRVAVSKPVFWTVDGQAVYSPSSDFYVYFPPYSWASETVEQGTEWEIKAFLSLASPPLGAPAHACIIQSELDLPESMAEVERFFSSAKIHRSIEICRHPSPVALRVKEIIDGEFKNSVSIGEIAKRMRTSGAYLSRQFKASYGFAPNYYKTALRVSIAVHALTLGKPPVEAASLSGFNDLGRFYKQFSHLMKSTPGKYQAS